MKTERPVIVWFRSDLRVQENPALTAAIQSGSPIIPLFLWSPEEEGEWAPGEFSRWWLVQSLKSLKEDLLQLG